MLGELSEADNVAFIGILVGFLTYGDSQSRQEKHTKEVEIFIESLGENFGANELFKAEYLHDTYIRVSALNYVLTSKRMSETLFFDKLINALISR